MADSMNLSQEAQNYTQIMNAAENILYQRSKLASRVGQSFDGRREIYKQAGYPEYGQLAYEDFRGEFDRHGIAKRVVTIYPDSTWREKPEVLENEKPDDTEFEEKWKEITKRHKLFHYLKRADILANIGMYSVVLLGFDDKKELRQPVSTNRNNNLIYVQVYSEDTARITEWETDTSNPRFGAPKMYKLDIGASPNESMEVEVHHSRVLHVCEECLDNDWFGEPRLRAVYNRLKDLDTIFASAAEGFWRNAWPGIAAIRDSQARWTNGAEEKMGEEMQDYIHNLTRMLKLEGVNLQELSADISSPRDHVDVNITAIATAIGAPKRIFLGSEEGERASEEDRQTWDARIDERRNDWAVPSVLVPLIEKLQEANTLPETLEVNDLTIRWPLPKPGPSEQADIARRQSVTLATYFKVPGVQQYYPFREFLVRIMGHDPDEADQILSASENDQDAEDAELAPEGEENGPSAGLESTNPSTAPSA